MRLRKIAVIAAAAVTLARPLAAQADVIRGRITSAVGDQPLDNASVTATSLGGGVNRSTRTDRNGRYTITFPGGEGDYFITVMAIGYVPRRFEVKRTADQDILIADMRLSDAASVLDTVVTVGQRERAPRSGTGVDISGTERQITPGLVSSDQMGNLASMAASLAGVLFVQGMNGDPSGYSVLGLDGLQNSLMLNGMTSGATDIPRDADVSVSLVTSPFDVSQGQFSGGQVNVRVRSGSNYVSRTSSLLLNAPQLQWTDAAGRALGQQYTNLNLSGSASGPISFDRAFYNVSYQLGRRGNDLRTLLDADPLALQTAGVSGDSVRRLVDILQTDHVPSTVPRFPTARLSDQGLILGSLDFTPLSSNSGQSFNLTFNGGWSKLSPASLLTTALPASSFNSTNWNGSVQAHHTNYFGFVLSETGLSVARSRRFLSPYLELPSGSVLLNSGLGDNSAGTVQSIGFGGTPASSSTTSNSIDLTNQLSWFSLDNEHRVKLTSELRRDGYLLDQATNHLGTFAFNSLDDLAVGRPASFTRQLTAIERTGDNMIGALSLGDSYRINPDFQFVYGARIDANRFGERPARNPDVERVFGVRNDAVPDAIYASPRVGFSWTYGTAPQVSAFEGAARAPRAIVRGGIGVFQNSFNATLPSPAISGTGLPNAVQQITCTGVAAPIPNWSAYAADSSAVPRQCADGSAGTVFASAVPNVTLFAPAFAAQRSVRSTLQWAGPVLANRLMATVTGTYSLNLNQAGFVDLNLDPTTRFVLSAEGNRPVFVAPSSIDPATGAVGAADGRVTPLFNHVTELNSRLSSETRQVIFQVTPRALNTHYSWGMSYTLNSVRDRASGFTSTTGNPFDVTGGRAALDWRHEIQFNFGYNAFDVARVNWVETFFSGLPFTPSVAGDINGDGYDGNDRAFVFDPRRTADTALASAMQTLLDRSSRSVQDCLTGQLGRLAARNSCEGPWTSSAALSLSFNPVKVRMPPRSTLSFSVANPLAAADLLLHGQSGAHGWGQPAIPDSRLLVVRGFDPSSRAYIYDVNQRFGSTSQAVTALRSPVTVTAQLRVDVGPSRERQDLTRTLDRGRTEPGPKVPESSLKAMYSSAGIINPMAAILRAVDSLRLTGRQADSIATMNRWYIVHIDSIWSPLAASLFDLPDRYDRGKAYSQYRRAREASVDLLAKLAPAMSELLTAEQRRKLPALVSAYLDRRYLAAIRSGTSGSPGDVFAPGGGVPGGDRRGRGGGPGGH